MGMQEGGNIVGGATGLEQSVPESGDIILVPTNEKKKLPLKKILIALGGVVILVIVGVVGVLLAQSNIGVPREEMMGWLEEYQDTVVSLDDATAMIRSGGIAVPSAFREGTRDGFLQRMEDVERFCEKICDEGQVRQGSEAENELFLTIRVGIKERNTLYRRYFVENFIPFYDAFAVSFWELGVVTYERNDSISELMNSSEIWRRELAGKFDEYLSEASRLLGEIDDLGCETGLNEEACGELNEEYAEWETFIRDRSLTRRMFFGADDMANPLSEEFIGATMHELLQLLGAYE